MREIDGLATSSKAYYKKEQGVHEVIGRKAEKYPESHRIDVIVSKKIKEGKAYNRKRNAEAMSFSDREETEEEWIERISSIYNKPELCTEDESTMDAEWKEWAEGETRSK